MLIFKDCKVLHSLLERLLIEECVFTLRISAMVDATKAVRLGLPEKEGNLSDFLINLGIWDDEVVLSMCSSNRVSMSIVSMMLLGSCFSTKVNKSWRASSDFCGSCLIQSAFLEYKLLKCSFLANRFRSLIVSKVFILVSGQKLRPFINRLSSVAVSV